MAHQFRDEIVRLSGSGKRVVSTRRHGIYSTFTLPGLDDMTAVRDTKIRFDDFFIAENLHGKSFLDIGANVGAMAFEAARRGAEVTGFEYREDRVILCNAIANHFNLKANFFQGDLNEDPKGPWRFPHDLVLCSSVDEYIDDLESFHELLYEVTKEVLYFESNKQRGFDELDIMEMLNRSGFTTVKFLGNGHSGGISRKRKLFKAEK